MNNLFRLAMGLGVAFLALLLLLIALAQHNENLSAPVNFIAFMVILFIYMLPTAVAMYRDCDSALWIMVVNVLLGWTIAGWIVALTWAYRCRIKSVQHPPNHPLPSH